MTKTSFKQGAKTCVTLLCLHDWGKVAAMWSVLMGILFYMLAFMLSDESRGSLSLAGILLILFCSSPLALMLTLPLVFLRKCLMKLFPGLAEMAIELR